jgi:hypothetical protein
MLTFDCVLYTVASDLWICDRLVELNVWLFKIKYLYAAVFSVRYFSNYSIYSRSQWPIGLKPGSAATRLLALRVRISPVAWISVCFECCMLSGSGLCVWPILRPKESYRMWCVVCDLCASRIKRPWRQTKQKKKICRHFWKMHEFLQFTTWGGWPKISCANLRAW